MDWRAFRIRWTAVVCVFLLVCTSVLPAGPVRQEGTTPQAEPAKIPNEQLDSLVAPIALYPDPVLAQVLAASTYPLELIQLQQWLSKNPKLKDKALTEAVQNAYFAVATGEDSSHPEWRTTVTIADRCKQ